MSYTGKTNWQYDEIVTETDLNRIEQGVVDAHAGLEDITPGQIGAVSKTEFDEHVNDTGLHVTAQKQQEWNNKANAVHEHAASAITTGTIAAARLPSASVSAAGISKLNNTITSSSTTEAAAAAAVKQVNDKFSNMIRVNGGKLEYWNGSAWKGVGGVTHLVNSTTVVQEKTTGNVVLQADERKFLFAFYPKGTGAINVYASFKDPEIAMENQRAKIIFTSSTRYGSSATRPDLVKVDYHSVSGNGYETYFDLTLPQGAASRSANNTDSEAAFDVRLPPGSSLTLIGRIVINNTSPITFEISNPSYVEQTLTALQLRYTIKEG